MSALFPQFPQGQRSQWLCVSQPFYVRSHEMKGYPNPLLDQGQGLRGRATHPAKAVAGSYMILMVKSKTQSLILSKTLHMGVLQCKDAK